MVLVELTSVDLSVLPMEAFKAHLRLGTGFGEDTLQDEVLESYLRSALAAVEARIGKMLLSRDAVWELTQWSNQGAQPLPVAPVSSLLSIVLVDGAGDESPVDPARYRLERDAHRPRVVATGGSLPTVPANGRVKITFRGGFGLVWGDVPADLREAVFLLAAHYYENRTDTTGAAGLMPFGVMSLLDAHRTIRTLGAR